MKKLSIYAMAIFFIATMLMSCGGNKQVVYEQKSAENENPFGDVYSIPCEIYDTPEEFAATGIFKGSSEQKGEVHKYALANAQQIIRMKFKHAYKGMLSDYSGTIGNNRGNDIEAKIEMAGDQIINIMLDNTSESCVKYSKIDEKGMIECYVAIKISKTELSQKVASKVANVLTDEEKLKINFDEEQYRKKMEKKFQNFKEEN